MIKRRSKNLITNIMSRSLLPIKPTQLKLNWRLSLLSHSTNKTINGSRNTRLRRKRPLLNGRRDKPKQKKDSRNRSLMQRRSKKVIKKKLNDLRR